MVVDIMEILEVLDVGILIWDLIGGK